MMMMVHKLFILCLLVVAVLGQTSTLGPSDTPISDTTKPPTVPMAMADTTTVSTDAPTTKPADTTTVSTDAPTTQPADTTTVSTDAPTTQPPDASTVSTDAPTTKPPDATTVSTDVPTTKPPDATTVSTDAPTTKPPDATTVSTDAPTTKPPDATTVSTDAPTTKPPDATTVSTDAPTTKPPDATTVSTDATTTKPPDATTVSTDAPITIPPDATTVSTAEPTVTATTPPAEDPCVPNPCKDESTCEARNNGTFICLCPPGQTYDEDRDICEKAKVFPGFLHLGLEYEEYMADTTTANFTETAEKIVDALKAGFFGVKTYLGSRVLKLSPRAADGAYRSRSSDLVNATVENVFEPTSNITDKLVKEGIDDAIEKCDKGDCVLKGAEFTASNLCDTGSACDSNTTRCVSGAGDFTCKCDDGYVKTEFSDIMCRACPSGQKAKGDSDCVNCAFGYSGFNCNESWKRTLVIVASVLGGLLLITLILLPVLACKPSKKKSKKSEKAGIENAYVSPFPAKATLPNSMMASAKTAYANAGVPKIPRAMSNNNGWDRGSNLEMTESNSRQNLVPRGNSQKYEEINNKNPYAQSRVQTNQYGQNRGQTNPYAQSQGQANPYYMQDNGQRLN